jgi:hypothetical protein
MEPLSKDMLESEMLKTREAKREANVEREIWEREELPRIRNEVWQAAQKGQSELVFFMPKYVPRSVVDEMFPGCIYNIEHIYHDTFVHLSWVPLLKEEPPKEDLFELAPWVHVGRHWVINFCMGLLLLKVFS